jgi:hypothetical protein
MGYEIFKVKDKEGDAVFKEKKIIWDLPFRLAIVGKSQISLGKTTIILNLLLRNKFYGKDFKGDNIYIITNNSADKKLQTLAEVKEIPPENIMAFNEETIEALYEVLEEDFLEEKKKQNRLILFDDVAPSGGLLNKGLIINKIVMAGRHIGLSSIFTSQKLSLLGTNLRSNLTGALMGSLSNKELELAETDFNFLESGKKADFIKLFRKVVKDKRDFLAINFTNKPDEIYLDKNFIPIKTDSNA